MSKKSLIRKGHVYSETINNWKYIVGENLFKVCYPKSFKTSNKVGVSTLLINVKKGARGRTGIFKKKYLK
ncbi:MAG: DciA family protein [Candidatus Pelagibacter sp.]